MPSASSIAAARKDTQRLRARSRDFVRRFHRCGQKRHTTTATYISGCLLTLPSLRSEKTHNDCELDRSTDGNRGFHRCGQKRHTTTWSECSALETKRIETARKDTFQLDCRWTCSSEVQNPHVVKWGTSKQLRLQTIDVTSAQDHVYLPLYLNQTSI